MRRVRRSRRPVRAQLHYVRWRRGGIWGVGVRRPGGGGGSRRPRARAVRRPRSYGGSPRGRGRSPVGRSCAPRWRRPARRNLPLSAPEAVALGCSWVDGICGNSRRPHSAALLPRPQRGHLAQKARDGRLHAHRPQNTCGVPYRVPEAVRSPAAATRRGCSARPTGTSTPPSPAAGTARSPRTRPGTGRPTGSDPGRTARSAPRRGLRRARSGVPAGRGVHLHREPRHRQLDQRADGEGVEHRADAERAAEEQADHHDCDLDGRPNQADR